MMLRQYSSPISVSDRNTMDRPVAIAMPSNPSHSPVSAMTAHSTEVRAGQGDTTASSGAKKKPVPTYQEDPARSHRSTNVSQRGMLVSVMSPA